MVTFKDQGAENARCLKITEKSHYKNIIKNVHNDKFWTVFENLKDVTKIGDKCQNSNETFWVIFKQCEMHFKSTCS